MAESGGEQVEHSVQVVVEGGRAGMRVPGGELSESAFLQDAHDVEHGGGNGAGFELAGGSVRRGGDLPRQRLFLTAANPARSAWSDSHWPVVTTAW